MFLKFPHPFLYNEGTLDFKTVGLRVAETVGLRNLPRTVELAVQPG